MTEQLKAEIQMSYHQQKKMREVMKKCSTQGWKKITAPQ